ncbi:hypothetical protein [Streptomyces griseorubiginosus]|uniref:hypothetical protein n=1 Tax=Streptomyces griseorubiginosus TaxID=67304 RepID=UPI0033286881
MNGYPEVVAWLTKKSREGFPDAAVLASKVARGAVRPSNLRMLPEPIFFEADRIYAREHQGRRIEFLVRLIDVTPGGAKYTAFGWRRFDGGEWEPTDSDDFTGWTEHFDKVPDPLDGCHWCACGNRWPCKGSAEVTG